MRANVVRTQERIGARNDDDGVLAGIRHPDERGARGRVAHPAHRVVLHARAAQAPEQHRSSGIFAHAAQHANLQAGIGHTSSRNSLIRALTSRMNLKITAGDRLTGGGHARHASNIVAVQAANNENSTGHRDTRILPRT